MDKLVVRTDLWRERALMPRAAQVEQDQVGSGQTHGIKHRKAQADGRAYAATVHTLSYKIYEARAAGQRQIDRKLERVVDVGKASHV